MHGVHSEWSGGATAGGAPQDIARACMEYVYGCKICGLEGTLTISFCLALFCQSCLLVSGGRGSELCFHDANVHMLRAVEEQPRSDLRLHTCRFPFWTFKTRLTPH